MASADKGEEIHLEVMKRGLIGTDDSIGNALLEMYAKCGELLKAQQVFDLLHTHDTACWTALLSGYAEHGYTDEALNCFERMRSVGISPNTITFIYALKACCNIRAAEKGKEIHAEIVRDGLLKGETLLGTTLIDMYAKCGALIQAQEVFDYLEIRDLVSWNTLIAGYAEEGDSVQVLQCFKQMQNESLFPNAATFVCAVKACSIMGTPEKAKEIHVGILGEHMLETDLSVGNALLDTYAKCGNPLEAYAVFDQLPLRDLVSWTALMAAYCQIGNDEMVINLFDGMIQDGIEPDLVTFTVVLNACSHSGCLEKGVCYFEVMLTCYCITPTVEHYTCMIDLFSRAGHFCKVIAIIHQLPANYHLQAWADLLARCL
jgi:pentatricopeptide repeat protein